MAIDEQSPIMRISASWPLPEPGRSAALRELASAVKYSTLSIPDPASAPAVPSEPDVRAAIAESNSLAGGEDGEPQQAETTARVAARPDSIEQDATAKASTSTANVHNDLTTTTVKAADKKKPAKTAQRKKRKIVVSSESGSLSNDTYVPNSTVPVAN
jgi:hypothetical protein